MSRNSRYSRVKLPVLAALSVTALGAVAFTEGPAVLHAAGGVGDTARTVAYAPPPPAGPAVTRLEDLSDAFASVAARVKPSVVFIVAKEQARPVSRRGGDGAPDMSQIPPEFRQFFRNMPGMPDSPAPRGGGIASGSGFIVSPDGYILTNNHVVDGASSVTVRLLDRREFKAKVVGRDANTDVAVIKIDANGLTPAPLGNSDASRVGEWVLAVGNPLGENLTFTVTQGIISAKGRALDLEGRTASSIQDFIQTDAAINPGNSGGPLVNTRGEVIGINSAIESPTGYNAGYGFAVPINLARAVMEQIVKNGRVERAALGVTVRDAGANDAAYAGLKQIHGVLVEDYGSADSPAKRAGIQPGDVIVAVDGKPVDYVAQLQEEIAFRKPGDVVSVEVARKGGQRVTLRVPLQRVGGQQLASADDDASSSNDSAKGSSMRLLGVSVTSIDDATARELQLPSSDRGVLVVGVDDNSAAYGHLAPAQAGGPDVILSVEGKDVHSPEDLRNALSKSKAGDIVSLTIYNAPLKAKRIERIRLGGE